MWHQHSAHFVHAGLKEPDLSRCQIGHFDTNKIQQICRMGWMGTWVPLLSLPPKTFNYIATGGGLRIWNLRFPRMRRGAGMCPSTKIKLLCPVHKNIITQGIVRACILVHLRAFKGVASAKRMIKKLYLLQKESE